MEIPREINPYTFYGTFSLACGGETAQISDLATVSGVAYILRKGSAGNKYSHPVHRIVIKTIKYEGF